MYGGGEKIRFLQAVCVRRIQRIWRVWRVRHIWRVRCVRRVWHVRHVRWWGKYQDFMLMRFFISIDMIGCGGDVNQSDSCKQCT